MIKVKCNEVVIKEYEIIIDEEARKCLLDLLQYPKEYPESAYHKTKREALWEALNNPKQEKIARN